MLHNSQSICHPKEQTSSIISDNLTLHMFAFQIVFILIRCAWEAWTYFGEIAQNEVGVCGLIRRGSKRDPYKTSMVQFRCSFFISIIPSADDKQVFARVYHFLKTYITYASQQVDKPTNLDPWFDTLSTDLDTWNCTFGTSDKASAKEDFVHLAIGR